jgi:hypothetical protein
MKVEDGRTPLNRAVELRAEAVVKLLMVTGQVDPDAKDKYGRTLLSRAVQQFQDKWAIRQTKKGGIMCCKITRCSSCNLNSRIEKRLSIARRKQDLISQLYGAANREGEIMVISQANQLERQLLQRCHHSNIVEGPVGH